jgi:hypothetical protein
VFDLDAALRYLVVNEGSDLHLKVPSRPIVRVHGSMEPIEGSVPLAPSDTEGVVREMLTDPNKLAEFEADHEVDFSYAVRGLGRFRVNAFYQRGSISLVMRAIPVTSSRSRSSAPARPARARRQGARDHPPDRHHGLGQVDDARGDHRPHQPHDAASTSSRSRTRSSSCTATAARSSTSARSGWTRPPSSARCAASCARTPT